MIRAFIVKYGTLVLLLGECGFPLRSPLRHFRPFHRPAVFTGSWRTQCAVAGSSGFLPSNAVGYFYMARISALPYHKPASSPCGKTPALPAAVIHLKSGSYDLYNLLWETANIFVVCYNYSVPLSSMFDVAGCVGLFVHLWPAHESILRIWSGIFPVPRRSSSLGP